MICQKFVVTDTLVKKTQKKKPGLKKKTWTRQLLNKKM